MRKKSNYSASTGVFGSGQADHLMSPNNRNPLDPHLLEVTISNDQIACLGLERESHQIIVVGIVGDDAGRIRGIIESDPLFRQTTSEGRYVFGGDVVLRGYTRVQKGILDFLNEPGADDNLELTIKRGIEGGPGSPQRSEGLVALYCDAPMVEPDKVAHGRPLKDGYRVEFADEFDGSRLDAGRWVPAHLPQWSSRAQAAARYSLRSGHLFLQILEDQPPWCPEFDGLTRVSSLQTGVLSGPTGSVIGQHRFNEHVVVREQQAPERLYTPLYGYFEMRARAVAHPSSMVALWMIGYEEAPEHSGEICVCEIFGATSSPERSWWAWEFTRLAIRSSSTTSRSYQSTSMPPSSTSMQQSGPRRTSISSSTVVK
jgi:hypothetical protein